MKAIVQQVAAQLLWFHHCLLLNRVKDLVARLWYVRMTLEHGWSRVGVASYVTKLVETLLAALRGQLPDPKQLKAALKQANEPHSPK